MISIRWACGMLLAIAATTEAGGLERGTPDIKSAGPLAFGPDGVLFVGDPVAGVVFAIDTEDRTREPIGGTFYLENINEKIDAIVAPNSPLLSLNDLAINPASGKAYLSVEFGSVNEMKTGIVRVDRSGKVELVSLRDIPFSKASLPDPAPATLRRPGPNSRGLAITDLAFVEGQLYIAGLSSNPRLASRIVTIAYPLPEVVDKGTIIEIFQGASGQFDTTMPIWTFAACKLKGEPYFLAAYSQTPLVKIPISALKPGTQVRATTVAELGNRNNPLDMLVYAEAGKNFLVVTNSRQGMMKISLDWLADAPPIESRLVGPAGLPYTRIDLLKGVTLMDTIDSGHALAVGYKSKGGSEGKGGIDLFAIPVP